MLLSIKKTVAQEIQEIFFIVRRAAELAEFFWGEDRGFLEEVTLLDVIGFAIKECCKTDINVGTCLRHVGLTIWFATKTCQRHVPTLKRILGFCNQTCRRHVPTKMVKTMIRDK